MPITIPPRSQFQNDFRILYDRAYRYIALRLPSREDCEDATAETLTSAWEHIAQFNGARGELPGWIIGIARHKIADYWRKRRLVLTSDDVLDTLPAQESGQRITENVDQTLTFAHLMRSLPQEAKALLTLRHVDGLSHEEIAEVVDKSPEAVRQILSRLHRRLKAEHPDYE